MIDAIAKEREYFIALIDNSGVSDNRKKVLYKVAEDVAFMKCKLDETREQMQYEAIAIPYDNGGGQSGMRENPIYKGYENLWKAYMQGIDKILSLYPDKTKEAAEVIQLDTSTLDAVRNLKQQGRMNG